MNRDEIRQSLLEIQEKIAKILERYEHLDIGSQSGSNQADTAPGGPGTFVDKVTDGQRGSTANSTERKG